MNKNLETKINKSGAVASEQVGAPETEKQQVFWESLSETLQLLTESINQHNIYNFRYLLNKLNSGFAAAGLTKVADKLQYLDAKCVTAQDLVLNEIELQELIRCLSVITPSGESR